MSRLKTKSTTIASLAAAALVLTACSGGSSSEEQADGLKVGPGVTDDTIRLGHLTDISGPFGPVGIGFLEGAKLFVKDRNAAGGVCDRKLELVVEDHGYDVQRAVAAYRKIKDDVLGIEAVLGGGMANALLPELERDEQLATPLTWTSSMINGKSVYLTGADYEVQIANGMSWAAEEKGLEEGDSVGFVGLSGEVGEAVLAGVEYVAKERGLKVSASWIAPTDTDFTGAISTLKSSGAKVIAVMPSTPQLATLMSTAESVGLKALWVGASPGIFDTNLLKGAAKETLENDLVISSGQAPWAADTPAAEKVRESYAAQGSKVPQQSGILTGYAQAEVFAQVLDAACAKGDLTRSSILATFQSMDAVDTGGLISTLDFTRGKGKSQSLESTILRPNSKVDGGLEVLAPAFISQEVSGSDF